MLVASRTGVSANAESVACGRIVRCRESAARRSHCGGRSGHCRRCGPRWAVARCGTGGLLERSRRPGPARVAAWRRTFRGRSGGERHRHLSPGRLGPTSLAKALVGHFGPEEIAPYYKIRQANRISTSKLLPEILQYKQEGLSYREIGEKLGLTKRQVEHVMASIGRVLWVGKLSVQSLAPETTILGSGTRCR